MQRIKKILAENIVEIVFTDPKNKDGSKKIKVTPILHKGSEIYHCTIYIAKQVAHKNIKFEEIDGYIEKTLINYKQVIVKTTKSLYHITNYNKIKIKETKQQSDFVLKSHDNNKKNYINVSEKPAFFQYLGMIDKNFNIKQTMQSKYRQINKYIEIISDIEKYMSTEKQFTIVDFGCGKGYLTFSLYFYLAIKKNYNVKVIGVDLKQDVISKCNEISSSLNYENLSFVHGDIMNYKLENCDMIISLHACNNATDSSIIKALENDIDHIYLAPCCHQEVVKTIKNSSLDFMLKHGIVKENFSALLTDSLRALFLESFGYNVKVFEFIGSEHTPKNIMVKGHKMTGFSEEKYELFENLQKEFSLNLFLSNEMKKNRK